MSGLKSNSILYLKRKIEALTVFNSTILSLHYASIYFRDKKIMSETLTATEKQALVSLPLIMALRMIALFMALPLFALYASTLFGATPALVGLALGIYGLSQALFQIPFGTLSDRYGRKPIIAVGLIIFIAGSFLAGWSTSIYGMIVGRTLQGMGAVGSALLALLADCTRDEKRTLSMAVAGISIGAAFGLAMLIGPLLTQWITVKQLFFLAGIFGIFALILLFTITPNSGVANIHQIKMNNFIQLLLEPNLKKLNGGIFLLHAIFSATFVVLPHSILDGLHLAVREQWSLYLPSLLIAFPLSFFFLNLGERAYNSYTLLITAICTILISELLLVFSFTNFSLALLTLTLFFLGFSLLEALLPSLISKIAPKDCKGTALGIYSCAQFLGIFAGGLVGGLFYGHFNTTGVYCFGIFLCLLWLSFFSIDFFRNQVSF